LPPIVDTNDEVVDEIPSRLHRSCPWPPIVDNAGNRDLSDAHLPMGVRKSRSLGQRLSAKVERGSGRVDAVGPQDVLSCLFLLAPEGITKPALFAHCAQRRRWTASAAAHARLQNHEHTGRSLTGCIWALNPLWTFDPADDTTWVETGKHLEHVRAVGLHADKLIRSATDKTKAGHISALVGPAAGLDCLT